MSIFKKKNKGELQSASSSVEMRIILEHSGNPLYELNSNEYSREIIIGRNADCPWTLDGVDTSASGRHAILSKRKNNFYITDLGSRNGIYFQNKRVKERKLAIGDKISLGECVILVEQPMAPKKNASKFHRLQYTNEKGKTLNIDIAKPQILIGSAKECDLVFQDQLISSRHAEISLRSDGSCWIKDLNSRNGTNVNGTELLPDTERMLQDNDSITIAYLDIKFLDASVEHQESRLWTALVTLVITALVIMSGYIGYMKLSPDANELLSMAKREMNAGRLETAKKLISQSVHAENSKNNGLEREYLLRRIQQWEKIQLVWNRVKAQLDAGQYVVAVRALAGIDHDDLDSWTWPGGANEKKKAVAIKKLLDSWIACDSALKNEQTTINDVENCRRVLRESIAECRLYKERFFTLAIRKIVPFLRKVDAVLVDNKALLETLQLLDNPRPDFQIVLTNLRRISQSSHGPVKRRANQVLPSVQVLSRENMRILHMVDRVCAMDFAAVEKFNLDFGSTIDFAAEKNVGSLKKQLEDNFKNFKDTSIQLARIYEALVKKGVVQGKTLPVLKVFYDPVYMKNVYSCDCLDMPLPRGERKNPAGNYDDLLGIEFFYDYLSNLSETVTMSIIDLPFKPKLYLAKEVMVDIEKFISFADREENQWFNQGKFASYLRHCKQTLQQFNTIIAREQSRKYPQLSREFLISRGIVLYLLPDNKSKEKEAIQKQLIATFSKFKREKISKLYEAYNLAFDTDREEAKRIRYRIIRTGLPGDRIVKNMWKDRPVRGWGK